MLIFVRRRNEDYNIVMTPITIKLVIYAILSILIFAFSLRLGKVLRLYHDCYQEISSITADNSLGFNLVYRIIFTPIIILLIGEIFSWLNLNDLISGIWTISLMVIMLQIATLMSISRISLVNFRLYAITATLTIILSLLIEKYVLPMGIEAILPDAKDISTAILLGITAFIYGIIKNIPEKESDHEERVGRYIKRKYKALNKRYSSSLSGTNLQMRAIIISLMIYEDYNRPRIIRICEKILGTKTTDILQNNNSITDEESIRKKINEITYLHGKKKFSEKTIRNIFSEHNPGSETYSERVFEVYERIKNL